MARRRPAPVVVALVAAAIVASASSSGAQDRADPLRFLKPTLDGDAPAPDGTGVGTRPGLPADGTPMRDPRADAAIGQGDEPFAGAAGQVATPDQPGNDEPPPTRSEAVGEAGEAGEPPSAEPPRPIRLGVLAGRDVAAIMAAVEPVTVDLGRILGRAVEILPMSSYRAMLDAQTQRRIDGGFYSTSAYALAEASCRCLEPIVAPTALDDTSAYHAIIVARQDSGIGSAAELEGRTVAAAAADSVGGRRMQLAGLLAEGIDPGLFASLLDAGSSEGAVRSLETGEADAAFAWSSLAGDLERGYSRGTLADLVSNDEIAMRDLAVIWRSPPIPHGPLAVLSSIEEDAKREIESYFLNLAAEDPEIYDALNPYYAGGYIAAEPGNYRGLDLLTSQEIDSLDLPRASADPASNAAPQ